MPFGGADADSCAEPYRIQEVIDVECVEFVGRIDRVPRVNGNAAVLLADDLAVVVKKPVTIAPCDQRTALVSVEHDPH